MASDLGGVPIIYAGDIFNEACPSTELINWVIEHLPFGYAIPGNHDLPLHNYNDMKKSGYWTLCLSKTIQNLNPLNVGNKIKETNLCLHAYPWGFSVKNTPHYPQPNKINIAIIHDYIWNQGHCFPGVPAEAHASIFDKLLKGFDAAVFGDNHHGFLYHGDNLDILNGGCFIRRTESEVGWQPKIGIIMSDGKSTHVETHALDTRNDKFILPDSNSKAKPEEVDSEEFIKELEKAKGEIIDFGSAISRRLKMRNPKVIESVKKIIIGIMEDI